jgi:capsular exopolysaccharide synthesis family protein
MNERKSPISRIPVPVQAVPAGIGRVVVNSDPGRAERPILGVLVAVWRGRWIVLACVAISLLFGYYRARTAVPAYSASSIICVQQQSPIKDPMALPGQSPGYLNTQCEIIHSTALLTKALTLPGIANADCLRGANNPVEYLKNAVIVGPDKSGADLIDVEMQSLSPNDAANIVNAVVSSYIAYQTESHSATAGEAGEHLQNSITAQEAELKTEQQKVTDFKKANPILVLEIEQEKRSGSSLDTSLTESQSQIRELKIASEKAQRHPDDPYYLKSVAEDAAARANLQIDHQPVVDPAEDAEYRRTILEMLNHGGEKRGSLYLNLEQKKNELETDLRQQKDDAIKRYTQFISQQLEAASVREEVLQKSLDDQRNAYGEFYAKAADYNQMMQDVDNTERELDSLRAQMKAVAVSGVTGVLTSYVLEPAKPNQTIGTGKSKIIGMSLVIGLMAGLGGSLLREMLEQRLRSVEEVSRLLTAPILGSVPHILWRPGRILTSVNQAAETAWLRSNRLAGAKNRRQWNSRQSLMQRGQTMQLQPRSDTAEAYRTIRTAIYFGLQGQPAKTILVTSPTSGDGKTTVVSNLAIAIAQTGRRVLLIDADCWHPSQHEIFTIGDGPGLTSILRKKAKLADAIRKSDIENLDVLRCGEIPNNPAELLESPILAQLLKEASDTYDQVLIDSPPVVPITDARILAANCGATILVLRAGKSTRRMADDAFEALASVGAPILGLVVNDVARQSKSRAHQYYQYPGRSSVENWDQYTPAETTNGHSTGTNGRGEIIHVLGEIIDHEEEPGTKPE